jgi:multimeric flavodoxin WrbA
MRITVLVGSPRKGGNTEMLADALIAGVRAAGGDATKYSLRGKKIGPCVNCDFCHTHDRCAIQDDMAEVYDLMLQTDVLVLASPVYFFTMSAQLKALLDRFYNPVRERFPIRATAVLGVCADEPPETFAPMLATFAAIEAYLHWTRLGEVTVPGMEKKGGLAGHAALDAAAALGAKLAAYAG